MDTNRKPCELTPYALELVGHKARQLVGTAGFTENDVEDIQQALIAHLLKRLPKFNPARASYNTFVDRVVEKQICNLIRDRQAEVRDYRREACSLNEEIDTGEEQPKQRLTTVLQDDQDIRTGKYARPAEERAQLQIDLNQVLAELPPDLRQVAEMLQTQCVSEVARNLGIPRRTFRDNHLAKLQAIFRAKGLGDYLR